jgi:hypothetical protein
MNTTDYIQQLIQEISSKGCTIHADLLQNNFECLVLQAKIEQQMKDIEIMFRKPNVIGDMITEPTETNEQN